MTRLYDIGPQLLRKRRLVVCCATATAGLADGDFSSGAHTNRICAHLGWPALTWLRLLDFSLYLTRFQSTIIANNVRRRWTDADNGSRRATAATPNTYTNLHAMRTNVHMFAYRRLQGSSGSTDVSLDYSYRFGGAKKVKPVLVRFKYELREDEAQTKPSRDETQPSYARARHLHALAAGRP